METPLTSGPFADPQGSSYAMATPPGTTAPAIPATVGVTISPSSPISKGAMITMTVNATGAYRYCTIEGSGGSFPSGGSLNFLGTPVSGSGGIIQKPALNTKTTNYTSNQSVTVGCYTDPAFTTSLGYISSGPIPFSVVNF